MKTARIIFAVFFVVTCAFGIWGVLGYNNYMGYDMSASANGGGPTGLVYMTAAIMRGTIGVFSLIISGVNAIAVAAFSYIIYKKKKQEK